MKRLSALLVGGVFFVAACFKLVDPPTFAHQIHNYGLVPEALRNPLALVLPWLEGITGWMLIAGAARRRPMAGAARWAMLLLVAFTGALAINFAQGHPVDCGCFGGGPAKDGATLLREMRWAVLRDVVLMFLCLPLLRTPDA
jgi:hypothetical protein